MLYWEIVKDAALASIGVTLTFVLRLLWLQRLRWRRMEMVDGKATGEQMVSALTRILEVMLKNPADFGGLGQRALNRIEAQIDQCLPALVEASLKAQLERLVTTEAVTQAMDAAVTAEVSKFRASPPSWAVTTISTRLQDEIRRQLSDPKVLEEPVRRLIETMSKEAEAHVADSPSVKFRLRDTLRQSAHEAIQQRRP